MGRLTEAQRAQLRELGQLYRAELPAKLAVIAGVAASLRTEGWDSSRLESLYHLVHKLTGSAAVYGLGALSTAAAEMETWTLSALASAASEERFRELMARLEALDRAVSGLKRGEPLAGAGRGGRGP
jgi:HPt (histidine-containing phosphotransfer) domain-containing protein